MKQLYTVLSFEFMNYAGRKSFRFLTIGLIIIIALVLSLPRIGRQSVMQRKKLHKTGVDPDTFHRWGRGSGGDLSITTNL